MNDQEHASQLSALFDNELPPSQAELVVRRALKDAKLRDSFSRYSLIGAALRGEPLAGCMPGDDVASRVSAVLAADPAQTDVETAVLPVMASRPGWARGAWGMTIAASVAAASLLLLRSQGGPDAPALVASAVTNIPAAVAVVPGVPDPVSFAEAEVAADLPSYTTPVDNSPPGTRISAPLVNYVVAHSDLPASVVRFSPLSSVMSASYDPAQGAVEMSEAEIGAHR